jgi:hypothetical protein
MFVPIVFTHEVERYAMDTSLEMLRLGVNQDLDVAVFAFCADLVERVNHLLWWELSRGKRFSDGRTSPRQPDP